MVRPGAPAAAAAHAADASDAARHAHGAHDGVPGPWGPWLHRGLHDHLPGAAHVAHVPSGDVRALSDADADADADSDADPPPLHELRVQRGGAADGLLLPVVVPVVVPAPATPLGGIPVPQLGGVQHHPLARPSAAASSI